MYSKVIPFYMGIFKDVYQHRLTMSTDRSFLKVYVSPAKSRHFLYFNIDFSELPAWSNSPFYVVHYQGPHRRYILKLLSVGVFVYSTFKVANQIHSPNIPCY